MASCKMERSKCLPPSTGEVAGLALDWRQPASSLAVIWEVVHAVLWGTSHYRYVLLGENMCALIPSLATASSLPLLLFPSVQRSLSAMLGSHI